VTGLKPTYGRVSKAGVIPFSYLFDHVGPIARTVEDVAIVLESIAGYDAADFSTVRAPVDEYGRSLEGGMAGLRVGVPRGWFFDRLDDDVRAATEAAIVTLRHLGADVRDVVIDAPLADLFQAGFGIAAAEAQSIHADAFRARPGDFGPDVAHVLSMPAMSGAAILGTLRLQQIAIEAFRTSLEAVDLLVTPTTPIAARPIGALTASYGGIEEPMLFALARCTFPFNATGLPALSVPCGFTRDGLPVGLQIAGRPFDEATVLRAGHAYERATDWHRRRPPLGRA
jgi:Asp-tRNA(Asn)/Glu-tRNA(Gln) amidotransferase A subunit family amidase